MNFGTNLAAELFHREILQCLVDTDNADNLYDDITVMTSRKEYDIALAKSL